MDQRPKPRIWNGEDYESDPDDDEKPRHIFSNSDGRLVQDVEMR